MSGKTYHWCHKEHLDGNPMWALHEPEDHGNNKFKKKKDVQPKLEIIDEHKDELRALLAAGMQDFP